MKSSRFVILRIFVPVISIIFIRGVGNTLTTTFGIVGITSLSSVFGSSRRRRSWGRWRSGRRALALAMSRAMAVIVVVIIVAVVHNL